MGTSRWEVTGGGERPVLEHLSSPRVQRWRMYVPFAAAMADEEEIPALPTRTRFARVNGVFYALRHGGDSFGVDDQGRLVPLDATYAEEMGREVSAEHQITEEEFWRNLGEPGG